MEKESRDTKFNFFNIEFHAKGDCLYKLGSYIDIESLLDRHGEIQGAADALIAAHKLDPNELQIVLTKHL